MTIKAAEKLGAKRIDPGINWTWACEFPSQGAAEAFIAIVEANDGEHRGIYPRMDVPGTFDVRFRY